MGTRQALGEGRVWCRVSCGIKAMACWVGEGEVTSRRSVLHVLSIRRHILKKILYVNARGLKLALNVPNEFINLPGLPSHQVPVFRW